MGLIEAMPAEFIECREQHAWVRDGTGWDEKRRRYVRRRRCPRCGTAKTQDIAADGSLMGSASYTHPDGYLIAGHGRIGGETRDAVRLYSLQLELNLTATIATEREALASRRGRNGGRNA
jgi:hypothetical protein